MYPYRLLKLDVDYLELDARELAEAIPPPPDLKSVLRSTSTSYKTSEQLGISSSEQEERLAAQERAIIETLEKEEQERLSSSGAGSSELHNRSNDGTDCDGLTAEIDQLALEWAADAMGHSAVSAGWKPPAGKLQHSFPPPPPPPIVMDEPAAVVQQRASVNRGNVESNQSANGLNFIRIFHSSASSGGDDSAASTARHGQRQIRVAV